MAPPGAAPVRAAPGSRWPRVALVACLAAGPWRILLAGDASEVVARHLARFEAMTGLTLRVERQTTLRGKSSIERWTFHQKGPQHFRIECEFPLRRLVVANPSELWEYVPEARKATRTNLAALDAKERDALLRAVLQHVALDGLRFEPGGPDTELSYLRLEEVNGRPAHCIECRRKSDKEERVVRGWIDGERQVLLRCEFVGKGGQPLAIIEAGDVFEAAPGLWFPRTLAVKEMAARGRSQIVTFQRVVVNGELPDTLFTFQPPEGVEVVTGAGK